MKHSVAKSDKKRKKEIAVEIEKLEEHMKRRHEKVFVLILIVNLQSFSSARDVSSWRQFLDSGHSSVSQPVFSPCFKKKSFHYQIFKVKFGKLFGIFAKHEVIL